MRRPSPLLFPVVFSGLFLACLGLLMLPLLALRWALQGDYGLDADAGVAKAALRFPVVAVGVLAAALATVGTSLFLSTPAPPVDSRDPVPRRIPEGPDATNAATGTGAPQSISFK